MPRTPAPDPTPRRFVVNLDAAVVDLAASELRAAADRHRRAAVTLSGELEAKRVIEGADIRTGALQVIRVLADADSLIRAAEQLENGYSAPTASPALEERVRLAELGIDLEDEEGEVEGGERVGPDGVDHAEDPDVEAARAVLGLVPKIPDPSDVDGEPGDAAVVD